MQEQRSPETEQDSPNRVWILALGGIVLAMLVCAALFVAAIIVLRPDEALPTLAAELVATAPAEAPSLAGQTPAAPETSAGEATAMQPPTPNVQEPLTPQAGGRSIGDPYAPELGNTGYDVQHYALQLALDPAVDHVEGAATIEALASLHGLAELALDFAGFEVNSVTVDGLAAGFDRDGKKLIITFPEPVAELKVPKSLESISSTAVC